METIIRFSLFRLLPHGDRDVRAIAKSRGLSNRRRFVLFDARPGRKRHGNEPQSSSTPSAGAIVSSQRFSPLARPRPPEHAVVLWTRPLWDLRPNRMWRRDRPCGTARPRGRTRCARKEPKSTTTVAIRSVSLASYRTTTRRTLPPITAHVSTRRGRETAEGFPYIWT